MNHNIQEVCLIVEAALRDGGEIVTLLAVMETQNKHGVNQKLSDAGAAHAGIVLRNAMLSRLATMIMREFATPRDGDLHIGRAFDLLKGEATADHFQRVGHPDRLNAALALWKKLKGDHRHERLKEFRDKEAAHLGKPNPDIPKPLWGDLIYFCNSMVDLIDLLAAGTGMANVTIRSNVYAEETATAFWRPWHAYAPRES